MGWLSGATRFQEDLLKLGKNWAFESQNSKCYTWTFPQIILPLICWFVTDKDDDVPEELNTNTRGCQLTTGHKSALD